MGDDLAAWVPDPRWRSRLSAVLPTRRLVFYSAFQDFAHCLLAEHVVGIACIHLGRVDEVCLLTSLSMRTARPLVIVSRLDPAAARAFREIPSRVAVVWSEELSEQLFTTLSRVISSPRACSANELLIQSVSNNPTLYRAIRRIVEGPLPPSVNRWAESAHVSVAALRNHISAQFPGLSPKQILDWNLLITTIHYRSRDGSWGRVRVATHLGVHERTLERISTRLLGCPLGQVESEGYGAVSAAYMAVIETVVGEKIRLKKQVVGRRESAIR